MGCHAWYINLGGLAGEGSLLGDWLGIHPSAGGEQLCCASLGGFLPFSLFLWILPFAPHLSVLIVTIIIIISVVLTSLFCLNY